MANLFGSGVYTRGGMTLYALCEQIGDANFAALLTTWTAEHRNGNATTQDLIDLAQKISGQDLGAFFKIWLFGTDKPPHP